MIADRFDFGSSSEAASGRGVAFRSAKARREKGGEMEREQAAESDRDAASDTGGGPSVRETKTCPYCAETILAAAIKCKHCGEFLSPSGVRPTYQVIAPTGLEWPPVQVGPLMPWVIAGGAAVALLGSLLPWASVSAGFIRADVPGTDGDGKLILIISLLVGALGLWLGTARPQTRMAVVAIPVVVLIGAGLAFADAAVVLKDILAVRGMEDLARVSVGIGLWLVLLGAGTSIVAGVIELASTLTRPPSA